jgi:hypothetical protein
MGNWSFSRTWFAPLSLLLTLVGAVALVGLFLAVLLAEWLSPEALAAGQSLGAVLIAMIFLICMGIEVGGFTLAVVDLSLEPGWRFVPLFTLALSLGFLILGALIMYVGQALEFSNL